MASDPGEISDQIRKSGMGGIDISVVLPAWNEAGNVGALVREFGGLFQELALKFEIIVVDGGSSDGTADEAEKAGAICFVQKRPGYGGALREGLERARGDYVLTLDCDGSHPPALFREFWAKRHEADILVASRYLSGSESQASWRRKLLSKVLNTLFVKFLQVTVRDLSSGYRLYHREVLRPETYPAENFNVLQEILVRACCDGFTVKEVPLRYLQRVEGASHASVRKFAYSYLRSFCRLWVLRRGPSAADYEHLAFDSRHILQRLWQRRRYQNLAALCDQTGRTLEIGCGSSRFTQDHPEFLAFDLNIAKLRFLKRSNQNRVQGTLAALPFGAGVFDQVVLSQVLPYLPKDRALFAGLNRIVKPGGSVVISIPDRSRLGWQFFGLLYRLLPNVDQAAFRAGYSKEELINLMAECGFRTIACRYVMGAELVAKFIKVEEAAQ